MAEILKVRENDFEKVYPLLEEFYNPYITKEKWKSLFSDPWKTRTGYCGYMLTDNDRAVGFIGLIFSHRKIGNATHRFCNLTSWIVQETYRKKSVFLLLPILKEKDLVLTDLTASKEVHALLVQAGFKPFETHCRILFGLPIISKGKASMKMITDLEVIKKNLEEKSQQIFMDHQYSHCQHVLIITDAGICYLLLSKMVRKKPPFRMARIHYISNLNAFCKNIQTIRKYIFRLLNIFALFVDERYLKGNPVPLSVKKRLDYPRLYRSEIIPPEDVDSLYSELILLNL